MDTRLSTKGVIDANATPISYDNFPRLNTTLLDSKDKIKIQDTPPSLEQAKGMPLPKEISLHIIVLVDHVVLGKTLPGLRFSSLEGCFSLQDPALSTQTHA